MKPICPSDDSCPNMGAVETNGLAMTLFALADTLPALPVVGTPGVPVGPDVDDED